MLTLELSSHLLEIPNDAINELNKQGYFIRASQSNSDWLSNIKSRKMLATMIPENTGVTKELM